MLTQEPHGVQTDMHEDWVVKVIFSKARSQGCQGKKKINKSEEPTIFPSWKTGT